MSTHKTLVIVESAGKIQKIQSILGPSYCVEASLGHIIDLDPKAMSINFDKDFEPTYIIIPESKNGKSKEQVVKKLQQLAKSADDVLIATDKDREGEMIAWSIAKLLKLKKPKRIGFHSITKSDVLAAVANPTKIDDNLVDAQKGRRVLDRIVGFELSSLLYKVLHTSNLSAGRVQSILTKLVIDKENEIAKIIESGLSSSFRVKGHFNNTIIATLHNFTSIDKTGLFKGTIATLQETDLKSFLQFAKTATYRINNIQHKEAIRNPSPPYTTSTLQQDANKKFSFSAKNTMKLAQTLYECGHITYMRTDSVALSKEALKQCEKYILQSFGSTYHRYVQYKSKLANAQEAHEAVRPTDMFETDLEVNGKITPDHIKLYKLIWKRTIASQMKPQINTVMDIQISMIHNYKYFFATSFETMKFPGFTIIYNPEHTKNVLPTYTYGLIMNMNKIIGKLEYSSIPLRYNEQTLIKKLEQLEIGRPATTATILENVKSKNHIEVKDMPGISKPTKTLSVTPTTDITEDNDTIVLNKETNKFVPTAIGISINKFITDHFSDIINYTFTADMETKLDKIANNELTYVDVMREFYDKFHPLIVELSNIQAPNKESTVLGKHPDTNGTIIATITSSGDHVIKYSIPKHPVAYANIIPPHTASTITYENALLLIDDAYPKLLGKHLGVDIILKKTKKDTYYLSHNNNFFSATKNTTYDDALKIMSEKSKVKKIIMHKGTSYDIVDGPYGHYIRQQTKDKKYINTTLPKNENIEELTGERILAIIGENKQKKKFYKKPVAK